MRCTAICFIILAVTKCNAEENPSKQGLFFRSIRFKGRTPPKPKPKPPTPVATKAPTHPPSEAPSQVPTKAPDAIVGCINGLTIKVQVDSSSEFIKNTGLCVLWKDGKPIARSYQGNDWEPYFDARNAPNFVCGDKSCTSSTLRGSYDLVSIETSSAQLDDRARFLQQGTFGPQIDEIQTITNYASWIEEQVTLPVTSHRAIYREYLNHRYPHASYQGRVTHPCEAGTRYRKYAFTDKDWQAEVEIRTISSTQKSLWVKNQFRTLVNASSIHVRSEQDHLKLNDGKYFVCQRVEGRIGGFFQLYHNGECGDVLLDGKPVGNPEVLTIDNYDGSNLWVVDLTGRAIFVDTQYHPGAQDLFVNSTLSDPRCLELPAVTGHPETTVLGYYGGSYYLHDPRFVLQDNSLERPNEDFSAVIATQTFDDEVYRVKCSSAPATFVNEDTCTLAAAECASVQYDSSIVVHLNLTNIQATYRTENPQYVYSVQGLRQTDSNIDTPCVEGSRSRWKKVITGDCSNSLSSTTRGVWENLIRKAFSSSSNTEGIIDTYMPVLGVGCDTDDLLSIDFKIQVDGNCWQNVHPWEFEVFDFTKWVQLHPGGESAIKQFAVDSSHLLVFPSSHEMSRFYANWKYLTNLGTLGDSITVANNPAAADIFRDLIPTSTVGSSLVCGSPFEVANDPLNYGSLYKGAFDAATQYSWTTLQEDLEEQRTMIWMHTALFGEDQLRQRVAWALSQILAVSPAAIEAYYMTENFLVYYDIFVRHAFGNYRDILKEVAYSPLMAEMLTFLNSESTNYIWETYGRIQYADENFAREVMQLFTTGLYILENDGRWKVDDVGNPYLTYNNDEISEFARLWTGFQQQPKRGNTEEWSKWKGNLLDPMMINSLTRDSLPKMGLFNTYIGDGYPLCADLPEKHFLKKGATYRLLGSRPKSRLLRDPESWTNDLGKKRLVLDSTTSNLYKVLCSEDDQGGCQFPAKIVLKENLDCVGKECIIESPRIIQVKESVYYEYTRLPCVEQAFYETAMMRIQWHYFFCGDPRSQVGSVACCNGSNDFADVNSYVEFDGERMSYSSAESRCQDNGMNLCNIPWWICDDCDEKLPYWGTHSCSLQVKIHPRGTVGIVHRISNAADPVIDKEDIFYNVKEDTKTFFKVDWEGTLGSFLDSYDSECIFNGCSRDDYDNFCLCDASVSEEVVFDRAPTREEVLADLYIGAFSPDILDTSYQRLDLGGGVMMYSPNGLYSSASIFEVIDNNGNVQLRRNIRSTVQVGSRSLKFRNPSHFMPLVLPELRDAVYETDAGLDQYFYHPSTAPFLAIRFLQRFGISNPSHRAIDVVATAFRTGAYSYEGKVIGSGNYGDMLAMVSAILLDRESRAEVLDFDPTHGSLQEPFLRVVRFMRSMEFKPSEDSPFVRFSQNLQDLVGQQPHKLPSVFSFFLPEYTPSGPIGNAGLVCPECQAMNAPTIVSLVNGLNSLLKYGLDSVYGGFGYGKDDGVMKGVYDKSMGYLTYVPSESYNSSQVVDEMSLLLTAGRMSAAKRTLLEDIFERAINRKEGFIDIGQLILTTPEFHTTGISDNRGGIRPPDDTVNPSVKPYKAVILLMLDGGLDSFNVLIPHVCSGKNSAGTTVDKQYMSERDYLAVDNTERSLLIQASNQPCQTFALHKKLELFQNLYNDGDLAFVANMGVLDNVTGMDKWNYLEKTKVQLFAHNWMTRETKTIDPKSFSEGSGILGRLSTMLKAKGYSTGSTAIDKASIAVDPAKDKDPKPKIVSRFGVNTFDAKPGSETFDLLSYAEELNALPSKHDSLYGQTWSKQFINGVRDAEQLQNQIEAVSLGGHWPQNEWELGTHGYQFSMISKLMKARRSRGVDRDVFYVQMDGWDHHSSLKSSLERGLTHVNEGLSWLVEELKLQGIWDDVTIVVASEFGRTLTPNTGGGSDHAWGGNYVFLGGTVNGGRILGRYPSDLTDNGPLNIGRGRFIPTTSWDAFWNGVVRWMGLTDESELNYCLPNRNFTTGGIFSDAFSESMMYKSAKRRKHRMA